MFLPFTFKPKSTIMKKWFIGSLVGAIIIFAWQMLSWMLLDIHDADARYTESQDKILTVLKESNLNDGVYMIPNVPPGSDMAAHEEVATKNNGKPWARVMYKKSYDISMTMPIIRGFLVDFFLVITLIYLLTRAGTPTSMRIFAGSVALGLFGFLWGVYTDHNWFQTPTETLKGHLIDSVAAWGICGLWLGWWLNRK